jgi:hypothetical protein
MPRTLQDEHRVNVMAMHHRSIAVHEVRLELSGTRLTKLRNRRVDRSNIEPFMQYLKGGTVSGLPGVTESD